MKTVKIKNIADYVGEEVKIQGWLYNLRASGKIWFPIFRDGTGLLQGVVFKGEAEDETFEMKNVLTQESSVIVIGEVRKHPKKEEYELGVKHIEIVQIAEEYPISKKEHGVDFLMNNRHLWLRSTRQMAIMKVRHEIIKAIRDFFDERDFVLMDSPMFTPSACEGTSTLFETDYFGRKAYLTQSGQLYAEAGAMAFGNVYTFGPIFRAEKSKTRRHLTEFWMVEPEMAYCDLEQDMDVAEDFILFILKRVLANRREELAILERDVSKLEKIQKPLPRITYDEATEILRKNGVDFQWGSDLGATDETILGEHFDAPVMIHRWPKECKAFYMKRDPEDERIALGVDVIAPDGFGEIIGGAQREDNLDLLLERIKNEDLDQKDFEWYLDLRRYGSVPHAGFGMGLERVVAWICDIEHVRETIPFARTMGRLEP